MTRKSRKITDRSVKIRAFRIIPCPPTDVRQPIVYRFYGHMYLIGPVWEICPLIFIGSGAPPRGALGTPVKIRA